MKHRRAQTVNVHARIGLAAEQFRRRIAHGAHRRDTLLFFIDPARNAKVDQHHTPAVAVDHEIGRLQVAINDRLGSRMQILKHVGNLHTPVGDSLFVDPSTG